MNKIILTVISAAVLGVASAQTAAPKQSTPTPAQAQKATNVAAANQAQAQAKTTNNMSRFQRTECARLHGTVVKNAKGNLVCQKPSAKK